MRQGEADRWHAGGRDREATCAWLDLNVRPPSTTLSQDPLRL